MITRVDYYDRATGAPPGTDNVTAFDLIFSNDAVFGNGDDRTVNVSSPGIVLDQVVINGGMGYLAQYLRWDVTATTSATANSGAAEFQFFTTVAPEPLSIVMWSALGAGLFGVALRRKRAK
jgi:hypothetical protein